MFSLTCAWMNGWVNNHAAGDMRRYHAHHDVTVMKIQLDSDIDFKPSCHWFCSGNYINDNVNNMTWQDISNQPPQRLVSIPEQVWVQADKKNITHWPFVIGIQLWTWILHTWKWLHFVYVCGSFLYIILFCLDIPHLFIKYFIEYVFSCTVSFLLIISCSLIFSIYVV